ncbi:hypothetical protein C1645_821716 [Glomus cerebriforme]|uniref:Uncharacterized protein n=1 Tax=Glomus cerebriforme TaxID=658196 RepID=A0A397T2W6_9GLOM|nr:hypothetical protein C1645_821716 [Glomus cerebriforme]
MLTIFFTRLSKNYIKILDDNEYYDITIEVDNDPNIKIFCAHDYPVLPFSIFMMNFGFKYIYGGIISLNEQKTSEILKVLAAADQLHLQELVDYLQKFLIENKSE